MNKTQSIAVVGVVAALIIVASAWHEVYADDGFVARGTVTRNLDSATDYWEYIPNKGTQHMRGQGLVQLGYKEQVTREVAVEGGVFHLSNPYTPSDYGQNGLYISGCIGNGC